MYVFHKSKVAGATWVAQLVERLTLDFGSGHDPRVVRLGPVSGSMFSMDSLSLPHFPSRALSPPPPQKSTKWQKANCKKWGRPVFQRQKLIINVFPKKRTKLFQLSLFPDNYY